MSEFTICNGCTLGRIKADALRNSQKVTTRSADGGVEVLVDGKFVAWFMDLSEHCACG